MGHLEVVLYEYLWEEYPEVLNSILGALKAIVNVIRMTKMTSLSKIYYQRLFLFEEQTRRGKSRTYFYLLLSSLIKFMSLFNFKFNHIRKLDISQTHFVLSDLFLLNKFFILS